MKHWILLLALVVLLLLSAVATRAQTGGAYDLTWSTIDGGGHMFSTGGSYSLGGTVGQADDGVTRHPLTGLLIHTLTRCPVTLFTAPPETPATPG